MRVRLHEGVLRDRVRLGLIAHDRKGHAIDLPLEALHQDSEGRTVAAEGALDQRLVAQSLLGRHVARISHAERRHIASHAIWTGEHGHAFTCYSGSAATGLPASATPPKISTAATMTIGWMISSKNIAPRIAASTGWTYVYMATSELSA